uniref:Uncharacterized protein n=1 Tax=Caudovirales sp. gcode 4 TaxID=2838363 RepID=A0A8S5RTS1_9CAUD|nr:MAG TPA: hypothetical protein [Caudovirales sp. gcode 4]
MRTKEDQLKELIEKYQFLKVGKKTTICLLTLRNGFEILTSSSCVNPDDYDREIGERISYRKAIEKLSDIQWYFLHPQN